MRPPSSVTACSSDMWRHPRWWRHAISVDFRRCWDVRRLRANDRWNWFKKSRGVIHIQRLIFFNTSAGDVVHKTGLQLIQLSSTVDDTESCASIQNYAIRWTCTKRAVRRKVLTQCAAILGRWDCHGIQLKFSNKLQWERWSTIHYWEIKS